MADKKGKTIPVRTAFVEWEKDPEFIQEFKALEDEFELAQLFIHARSRADLTQ